VLIEEVSPIDIDGTPGQELEELVNKLYTCARVDAANELRPIVREHFQQSASPVREKMISALIASLSGTQFWGGGFPETVADIFIEIGSSAVPDLVKALKHRESGVRFGVTLALYNMSRRYHGSLDDVSINDLFLDPEPHIRLNPYDRIVSGYWKKAFNYWEISMALIDGIEIKEVLAGPRLGLIEREFIFETIETYDTIDDLVQLKLSSGIRSFKEAGRSLIITTEDDRKLVIKFLVDRPGLDAESRRPENLENDARWMDYLRQNDPALSLESCFPEPLVFNNKRHIFAIRKMSLKGELLTCLGKVHLDPDTKYYAISYLPADSYLVYSNDEELEEKEFRRAALVNISDMAHLASYGIVHSEPINLYHNIGTRQKYNILISGGPGRVDKWLLATEYPNMRLSGIADFEHLLAVGTIGGLHEAISNELFAWVLVAASYYRIKCLPEINGKELFRSFVRGLLKEGLNLYYSIFAGNPSSELDLCMDWEKVAGEMTDHMMTDKWKHDRINPDLGKYNGRFPIDTLVRALYITATLAILNRAIAGPIISPDRILP